jgi:VanZ family protein
MSRVSVPFETRRPWLLVIALYVALIFFASSRPYLHAPGPDFQMKDKLAHALEYGLLGWFMSRAARPLRPVPLAVEVLWFVALGAGIAGLDELFQGTVPGRLTDVTDWMADVTGLLVGTTIAATHARRTRIAP